MRIRVLLIVAMLACATAALADVVYMRNGMRYEGTATRVGDKVRIEMPLGTIEVPAADVITIEKSAPASGPASAPQSGPASAGPALPKMSAADRATCPESTIFVLMRNLSMMPAGTASYDLREQIRRWRISAHDKLRCVGSAQWISPKDFTAKRQAYESQMATAKKMFADAKRITDANSTKQAEKKTLETEAAAKVRQSVSSWQDPLLRAFLMGVNEYHSGNYAQAEHQFRLCCSQSPRVTAFQQGLGMSLMKLGRQMEALTALAAALRLQPDSSTIPAMVKDAAGKVPGAQTASDAYHAAKKLLDEYGELPDSMGKTAGTEWPLPGKTLLVHDETIPAPPYDRLVFRQAVGVATGPSTLLVDQSLLKDALEVLVRIDDHTTVRAQLGRRMTISTKEPPPPVGMVNVFEYTFTPVKTALDDPNVATARPTAGVKATAGPRVAEGQAVKFYGISAYEEMGGGVRVVDAKVASVDANGDATLSAGLLPGEGMAPVIADNGELVGFLAAKTDAMEEGGGPDHFIPAGRIEKLLKDTRQPVRPTGGFGKASRNITPQPADGQYFVVYITSSEKFE